MLINKKKRAIGKIQYGVTLTGARNIDLGGISMATATFYLVIAVHDTRRMHIADLGGDQGTYGFSIWFNDDSTNDNCFTIRRGTGGTAYKHPVPAELDKPLVLVFMDANPSGSGGLSGEGFHFIFKGQSITFAQDKNAEYSRFGEVHATRQAYSSMTFFGLYKSRMGTHDVEAVIRNEKYFRNNGKILMPENAQRRYEPLVQQNIYVISKRNQYGAQFQELVGKSYFNFTIPIDYNTQKNIFSYLAKRVGNTVTKGAFPVQSTVMADYIYEGQNRTIFGLNLTGALFRSPQEVTDKGLPSNELPSSWNIENGTGAINLSTNKIGGTASGQELLTHIVNSRLPGITMDTQSPLGTNKIIWEQAAGVRLGAFNFAGAKVTNFELRLTGLTEITYWYLYSNQLTQSILSLCNNWAFCNCPTLRIQSNPNMTGQASVPNSYLTQYQVQGCGFDTFDPDMKNVSVFYGDSNKFYGLLKMTKAVELRLGTSTSGFSTSMAANPNAPAGEDFIDVDLSGNTVNISSIMLNGISKLRNIYLPENKTCGFFAVHYSKNWNLPNGWPVGFKLNGEVRFHGADKNWVFPLGTTITGNTLNLYDNSMTEEVINANIDNWIDNHAGFTFSGAGFMSIGGNNASVTNTGRPTRIAEMRSIMKTKNWLLLINEDGLAHSYFRIESITASTASPNEIIAYIPSIRGNNINIGAGQQILITDTANYNGTWDVIERGAFDSTIYDGLDGSGSSVYHRLRHTSLVYVANETGIVRKKQ